MDSHMTIQSLTTSTLSQHSPTLGPKRIMTDTEPTKKAKEDEINHASDALPSPAAEPIGSMEPIELDKLVEEIASPPLTNANATMMTRDQIRYATAVVRNLKKHRDAAPFLRPVDYKNMNVPDYPAIVSRPMDLNTVDRKLGNNEYPTVDDFVTDVRLVFSNCYKFNGPEATISMLCQNVESAFEKGLRQMPPSKELSPSLTNSPGSIDGRRKKHASPTAASITNDNIRRFSEDGRPRREVHPPPSKDYPETWTKKRNPKTNTAELKFCGQVIKELKKGKHKAINYPFLVPVDYVALNLPDYPSIVKEPMDLSTIEEKWNRGDYATTDDFEKDIRLMFNNCYLYNPPTLPVHQMAKNLEKVFDEKWQHKPLPESATPTPPPLTPSSRLSANSHRSPSSSTTITSSTSRRRSPSKKASAQQHGSELESSDQGDDENDDRIAELERHIASISQQIQSMKSDGKKRTEGKQQTQPQRQRRSSSQSDKPSSTEAVKRKRAQDTKPKTRRRTSPAKLPDFTFQQKSDLSNLINNLAGDKLHTVAQIIQSSMPNLDCDDEIELDINLLDQKTLHQLYEFVTGKPLTNTPQSRQQLQKSSSLKRPRLGYSEAASNRKIKELEQQLRRFEGNE
ncbi:unnamed protein product [Absidia cylindrospora]